MELFEVLDVAAQESSLQRGLLNRAAKLRWPVLAVLAACQPEASAAACMTVWLQATIAVEGKTRTSTPGRQPRNEQI